MPRRLIDRLRPDSIAEFRASALQRFDDGEALAAAGNRTGAIYLWGYAVEMTLKAAYFSLSGLGEKVVISVPGHIQPAIDRGRAAPLSIDWPRSGAGHNVRAWGQLLVLVRALDAATEYDADFAEQVLRCSEHVGQLWREILRYHKNRAYLHEVRQVHDAADWLVTNGDAL